MSPTTYEDHPIKEIKEAIDEHIARGSICHQRFTCSGCGERLMIEEPNVFYIRGTCNKCGVETDIEKTGCNYLVATIADFTNDLDG